MYVRNIQIAEVNRIVNNAIRNIKYYNTHREITIFENKVINYDF